MERLLQIFLIVGTLGFAIYLINMVRLKRLELKYTIIWIFSTVSFFIMAIFPGVIDQISILLHIKDPVNTLFFILGFYMIMIIFTLTSALSRKSRNITSLAQEIGLLKLQMYNLSNMINVQENDEKSSENKIFNI